MHVSYILFLCWLFAAPCVVKLVRWQVYCMHGTELLFPLVEVLYANELMNLLWADDDIANWKFFCYSFFGADKDLHVYRPWLALSRIMHPVFNLGCLLKEFPHLQSLQVFLWYVYYSSPAWVVLDICLSSYDNQCICMQAGPVIFPIHCCPGSVVVLLIKS